MREILFRAKATNRDPDADYRTEYQNGDWVYGWLTSPPNPYCPEKIPAKMRNTDGVSGIDVDFDTVGQYTGLMDKNGVKIFDGDIVRYNGTVHEVVFESHCGSSYYGIVVSDIETWGFNNSTPASEMEIIGNIYDNPELLEVNE